jgi:hypothetical protein
MAFWRKTIDLPQDFYRAAGECMLYIAERLRAAEQLQSSPMTFDQAKEVLNLSTQCLVRLRALISQYPIKSISSLGMRDQGCEETIQTCDEKMKAILALPNVDGSSLICLHGGDINELDVVHFERSVGNMYITAGLELRAATKEMAKSANINSDKFLDLATQTVRKKPHESV